MKVEITEEQINQLLEDVKSEFVALQKSDADALIKDFPPKKEEGDSEAPAAPAEEAPAEAAPEAEAEGAPADEAAPAPEGDPAAEGGVSPDELYDMYGKLDDETLAMHFMAASKAMHSRMEGGEEEAEMPPEEGAPPEAEAAPEAPAEEPAAPPFGKSEDYVSDEVIEAFEHLEAENKSLKDESLALKKKLDELADTMTKFIAKPVRAGFASGSVISEQPVVETPMTKSEIIAKLNTKAQTVLTPVEREQLLKHSLKPVLSDELIKFLETKQGA